VSPSIRQERRRRRRSPRTRTGGSG
jgi:hypothetical protein